MKDFFMNIKTTFLSLKFQINLKPKTFFGGGQSQMKKEFKLTRGDYFTTIKTLNICKLCFEFDYQNRLQITPNLRVEDLGTYL